MWTIHSKLARRVPSIYTEDLSCYEPRLIRSEEEHRVGDFIWLTKTAQRYLGNEDLLIFRCLK